MSEPASVYDEQMTAMMGDLRQRWARLLAAPAGSVAHVRALGVMSTLDGMTWLVDEYMAEAEHGGSQRPVDAV